MAEYDAVYDRIATALERIADATENIDSHQFNMRNDLHHLRVLGDHNGTGIRMTSPFGWLTHAYYYKWFIREGNILDDTFETDNLASAVSKMNSYMESMGDNFPGVYSYGSSDPDESPLVEPPHEVL